VQPFAGNASRRDRTSLPGRRLVWRATLSAAGLFAQLGAAVPTRGFHLAYSPGFRDGVLGSQPRFPRSGQNLPGRPGCTSEVA
jgi:hypothetical protein